jgi:fermentation-respiration switch protein FrsA (DUF1100 family)
MKRILVPMFAVLLAVTSALAADGKTVFYKSGDETVQGVLYTPPGKAPFPAIIVIHQGWELNDWVKTRPTKLRIKAA